MTTDNISHNLDDMGAYDLRPSGLSINLDAFEHNIGWLRRCAPKSLLMAVVKANAYGHGLVRCARHAIDCGAVILGVAFPEEGIRLRKFGIIEPIHVFGGVFEDQVGLFVDNDLQISVSSLSKLNAVNSIARAKNRKASIHLKIDTGMERTGVHYYNAEQFMDEALAASNCRIVGVFSHLACADEEDRSSTLTQIDRFSRIRSYLVGRVPDDVLFHLANSAGTIAYPECHFDMVRTGIAMYGVDPFFGSRADVDLRPVLSLHSRVVYFKVVKEGAGVSYGHRWRACADTRVVTVPVGYGDGVSRKLSNRGHVLIRGNRYPIIGSICMDQLMVSLGSDGEAFVGDEVVIIGSQGGQSILVGEISELAETIPYEVLTSLNQRLPRRYCHQE